MKIRVSNIQTDVQYLGQLIDQYAGNLVEKLYEDNEAASKIELKCKTSITLKFRLQVHVLRSHDDDSGIRCCYGNY